VTEIPENVITDWVSNKALDLAKDYILAQITPAKTKSAILAVLGRLNTAAKTTSTSIDDALLGALYNEFDSHWDHWFNHIADIFGLKLVPSGDGDAVYELPKELPASDPSDFASLEDVPEFLKLRAKELGISVPALLGILKKWYPVILTILGVVL